jgi:hypothetical protein
MSGASAQSAANEQARIDEQNAQIVRKQFAENERRFRIGTKREIGGMRAAIGASGVTLEGSPLDALGESAANAELDALTIRHGGEMKARGLELEAGFGRRRGRAAFNTGVLSAAGTLLEGAGRVSTKLKRTG